MATSVLVDGKTLLLNPFMSTLIGNVVQAVARSLKTPQGSRIHFVLRGEELTLRIDEQQVPLNLGHAQQIVGNILQGITRSLKGAEACRNFEFIYEL